ncbi:MAG TPA: DUF4168 domain-containing protein [Chroococcales cyanobacterium]|jgi:hypothetical protein
MMISYCFQPYFSRILSKSLLVGTLSIVGLLSGLTPGLSGTSHTSGTLVFSTSASAQSIVSKEEVENYARAVLAIEQIRQSAYGEIKKIVGDVPEIVCNNPASIRTLPGGVQGIARAYCQQSSAIVGNYFPRGNARFNEITSLMQNNSALRQRIQAELVRQQR